MSGPAEARHVLFDLDGTLSDPFEGITASVQYALAGLGLPVPEKEALRPFIGPPLGATLQSTYNLTDADAARGVALFREYLGDKGLYENVLFPGIPQLLASLQAGGRQLYLATSKPLFFATRVLAHFGLAGCFTACYGSPMDSQGHGKGKIIADLLAGEGFPASDAVMVGDTVYDIRGARENGMGAVGVLFGGNCSREVFMAEGACCVAESVSELGNILLGKIGTQTTGREANHG